MSSPETKPPLLVSSSAPKRRLLAPRQPTASSLVLLAPVSAPAPLEARRRATHNAVERRRRDTINAAIDKLAKLVPNKDGAVDDKSAVTDSKGVQSKGSLLARVHAYIVELQSDLRLLREQLRSRSSEVDWLTRQLSESKAENEALRQRLETSSNGAINNADNTDALASFLGV